MISKLTPASLRIVLAIFIALLILGAGFLVSFGTSELSKMAEETNLLARKARASENNLTRMESLKKRYEQVSDVIPIINKMVASQESYRYQDTSINVLTDYAKIAGAEISQISFALPKGTTATAPGAKNILLSVNLKNPTSYQSFIKFMRLVEGGLSQMQILQVDLRKDKDNAIVVGQIIIAIYIK